MRNSISRWSWLLQACLGACVTTWLVAVVLMHSKLRFSQALLRRVLPSKAIRYIEAGRNFCEHFEAVTVLFADIKSFTTIAAAEEPLVVVNMLNDLYKTFDALTESHGVYKVSAQGRSTAEADDVFRMRGLGVRRMRVELARRWRPSAMRSCARAACPTPWSPWRARAVPPTWR